MKGKDKKKEENKVVLLLNTKMKSRDYFFLNEILPLKAESFTTAPPSLTTP